MLKWPAKKIGIFENSKDSKDVRIQQESVLKHF